MSEAVVRLGSETEGADGSPPSPQERPTLTVERGEGESEGGNGLAIILDGGRPKWEKQDGETERNYDAFKVYLGMPKRERSLAKAANFYYAPSDMEPASRWANGATIGQYRTFELWSSRFRWVKRALAYDQEQDRKEAEEKETARDEMKKRHISIAKAIQGKVLQRLQTLQVNELSVADMKGLLDIAVKMERLSLGESTETIKQQGDPDNPLELRGDAARDEIARRIDSIIERRREAGVSEVA